MTRFDLLNLRMISANDIDEIERDLQSTGFDELMQIYKTLTESIKVCLSFPDIPYIVYTLASLRYIYGLEILSRMLNA